MGPVRDLTSTQHLRRSWGAQLQLSHHRHSLQEITADRCTSEINAETQMKSSMEILLYVSTIAFLAVVEQSQT